MPQAACETLRNKLRSAGRATTRGLRRRVCAALDDDFETPEALALLFRAPPEARDTVAEVLDVLGLGALARDEAAPAEVVALARSGDAARATARLRRVRPAARRDRRGAAGRCATPPTGSSSVRAVS